MSPLLEKVREALESFSVVAGEKVLVAVSGGPDSVCLLHLLKSLFPACPLQLYVAHLNHGLRSEAVEEMRFVESLSIAWGIPFETETINVRQYHERGSVQAQARRLRYQFLKKVARNRNVRWIALGHNADDQAETFLMRMMRGAGLSGLGGIPAIRDDMIIRPLLACTRDEIKEALSEQGIAFVEDPSNKKMHYQRNRIRHQLIPILQAYNPKIKATFFREATLLRDENDFILHALSEVLPSLDIRIEKQSVVFGVDKIVGLHTALQRRVIRFGLEALLEHSGASGFDAVEVIRQQIQSVKGEGNVYLGQQLVSKRKGRTVRIAKVRKTRTDASSGIKKSWKEIGEQILHGIGESMSSCVIDLPDWKIRLKLSLNDQCEYPFPASSPPSTCTASFDFDKICLPLTIRPWQQGDRFAPLGMNGHHKKLQDFFVDRKIEKAVRHRTPLLSCGKGILWVLGLQIDERFCVKKETTRVLTVGFQSIQTGTD